VRHVVARAPEVLQRRVRQEVRHARSVDAGVVLDLLAEAVLQHGKPVFRGGEIGHFRLGDERAHPVGLPPLPARGADPLDDLRPVHQHPLATHTAAASAAGGPGKPSTPAPVKRKLSNKEIKELTAALEQKYRDFLTLVDMIIADEERQVFLQIGDNFQKDRFIEAFWKRRSLDSRGLRTDFQRVYTQRVEAAVGMLAARLAFAFIAAAKAGKSAVR